jgi:hypothetical protein
LDNTAKRPKMLQIAFLLAAQLLLELVLFRRFQCSMMAVKALIAIDPSPGVSWIHFVFSSQTEDGAKAQQEDCCIKAQQ